MNLFINKCFTVDVHITVHGNDTYELRLVGGSTQYQGRLEIRRNNGTWGTVAGNNWSSVHASVACRSLGFSSSVLSPDLTKHFGVGAGPVHLHVHYCVGSELSLLDSRHDGWENSNDHSGDIGLHCLPGN